MSEFTLNEIAQKYFEYKETLEKIEQGDRDIMAETTIYQAEMMRKIVDQLEDMGFNLIAKRYETLN